MRRAVVWLLRVLVGGTFVVSGAAKMIDPYGFIYKIEQYLSVWHIADAVPEALVLLAAIGICAAEFLTGFMLASGSLRRTSAWMAATIMAVMLPLSIYIYVADPVDDCGCFGDFVIIGNGTTVIKNLILAAGAAYLVKFNSSCGNLFPPLVQWLQAAVAFAYIAVIGLVGYHVQPMVDFRPYPVGSMMYDEESDGFSDEDIRFVYADKSGERHEFSIDEVPDDDDPEWTFVGRVGAEQRRSPVRSLVVTDDEGNDVTEEVFAADYESEEQLILLIPDMEQAAIAHSYVINELSQLMKARGGSMVAVAEATESARDNWIDMSMADYPIYYAEATAIKTVARGSMALVYTVGGVIKWKRTVNSVNIDRFDRIASDSYGPDRFWKYSRLFLMLEILILALGNAPKVKALLARRT